MMAANLTPAGSHLDVVLASRALMNYLGAASYLLTTPSPVLCRRSGEFSCPLQLSKRGAFGCPSTSGPQSADAQMTMTLTEASASRERVTAIGGRGKWRSWQGRFTGARSSSSGSSSERNSMPYRSTPELPCRRLSC